MPIRIIKHEVVPKTGSFEVRFPDGRPSVYFYWDDIPGRRVRSVQTDSKRALEAAKARAKATRAKAKQLRYAAPREMCRLLQVAEEYDKLGERYAEWQGSAQLPAAEAPEQ